MYKVFVLWSDDDEIIDQYGIEKCLTILNLHPLICASKINIDNLNDLNKCHIFLIAGGEPYQLRLRMKGKGASEIRKFVSNGGGYIGICAGAVLALSKSPSLNLLNHVNLVNDNIWWNSGVCGDIKLKAISNDLNVTNGLFSYNNGPLFMIKKSKLCKPNIPVPIAKFDGPLYNCTEKISDEMMKQIDNSYAIISGKCGSGSVIISSIHPEYSDDYKILYDMIFSVL